MFLLALAALSQAASPTPQVLVDAVVLDLCLPASTTPWVESAGPPPERIVQAAKALDEDKVMGRPVMVGTVAEPSKVVVGRPAEGFALALRPEPGGFAFRASRWTADLRSVAPTEVGMQASPTATWFIPVPGGSGCSDGHSLVVARVVQLEEGGLDAFIAQRKAEEVDWAERSRRDRRRTARAVLRLREDPPLW